MRACFITGTDTGCGKTFVSAALLHGLRERGVRATGLKPVATGSVWARGRLENEDVATLAAASAVALPAPVRAPYVYEPPCSPHLAADDAGIPIDPARLERALAAARARADVVVVEGVGGWYVPLGPGIEVADLARRLALPVILVVGVRLGAINHALLSARAIAASGLEFAGWVANFVEGTLFRPDAVIDTLVAEIPAPCLGVIPSMDNSEPNQAAQALSAAIGMLTRRPGADS